MQSYQIYVLAFLSDGVFSNREILDLKYANNFQTFFSLFLLSIVWCKLEFICYHIADIDVSIIPNLYISAHVMNTFCLSVSIPY